MDLLLSGDIRTWVLIPLTCVLILVGLLRHHLVLLIQSAPKRPSRSELQQQRRLVRATYLRMNGKHLAPSDTEWRKEVLATELDREANAIAQQQQQQNNGNGNAATPASPLGDPSQMEGMMDGMKKQMVQFVPQTIIMGWINYFFSGFVLIKLPFPLTVGFKPMLQRGIETNDMDVTWVSSLSLYFLALFGLNSLFRLVLGDDNAADSVRDMQNANMRGAAPMMGPQKPDYKKLYTAEKENLDMKGGAWIGEGVEERVLLMFNEQE